MEREKQKKKAKPHSDHLITDFDSSWSWLRVHDWDVNGIAARRYLWEKCSVAEINVSLANFCRVACQL